MRLRDATAEDAEAIAALHADSWRRTYRGIYSDDYLDGEVFEDRLAAWRERLVDRPGPHQHTVVAERDGALRGFVHTILDADPVWGALLDNLHVSHDARREGLGTMLMAASARAVIDRRPGAGLYLWVLEGNTGARAFYLARGAEDAGAEPFDLPGGGTTTGLRYVWRDPAVLAGPPPHA